MKRKFNKKSVNILISCALSSAAFTLQAEPQTAPQRNMAPNVKYGPTIDDAASVYFALLEQRKNDIYPGFDQLPKFDLNQTYAEAGTKVIYQDGGRYGVFENKYWVKGEQPNFEQIESPWILIAETDASGYLLDEISRMNTWIEAATYHAGDKVKHKINGTTYHFEAKQWSKGKAPVITKQFGGTAEEWESDWTMLNNGQPVPDIETPEPPVKPEPPVEPETPEPPVKPEPPVEPETPEPPVKPEPPVEPDTENPAISYDMWKSDKIYLDGDRVTHIIDGQSYNFEAKYWVQGTAPFLTKSYGGTVEDWDTPWQILTDDESVKPEPEVPDVGKPDIEQPPVTPGEPDVELPDGEYAFLNELNAEDWDWFFPLRTGKYRTDGSTRNAPPIALPDGSTDVYTLGAFKNAVKIYNDWAKKNNYKQFLNEGTKTQQALEFASFFAKTSRETSGSWATAPEPWIVNDAIAGPVWKGGLYWVEENGYSTNPDGTSPATNYIDASSPYKPVAGRSYHGRGIIQLSWNYNYGQFSEWLFENRMLRDLITEKETLLKRPDYVANNSEVSFLSGIWFWMTPQGQKPSSHDVVLGNVYNVSKNTSDQGLTQRNDGGEIPTVKGESFDQAVIAYRLGTVTNIVNGGLECNRAAASHSGPMQRISYYNAYSKYLNASIQGVNVTTIDDATNVWNQFVSPSSPDNLKTASCYSMKAYYQ